MRHYCAMRGGVILVKKEEEFKEEENESRTQISSHKLALEPSGRPKCNYTKFLGRATH